ncbi:uncharacterized protein JCM15063_005162 [Sporobolomyces koalae]|uniref:uncharacterized protein n=1 Tax=Sporobolomyces koalae TaxID=500713 RepID=UPI00317CBCD6
MTTSYRAATTSTSSIMTESAAAAFNASAQEGEGESNSTSATGIGLGVGLGGFALLLLLGGLFWWRQKKANQRYPQGTGSHGSIAPTETTMTGFQSVSGDSPVSAPGRFRFPSSAASQSALPSQYTPSEYAGGGTGRQIPEVQEHYSSSEPAISTAPLRYLENPATFRPR